jgi:hypothetical protein
MVSSDAWSLILASRVCSAWRFYDIDSQAISEIRTSFLLRLLVVDPQPFDTLLRGFLRSGGKWQIR